MHYLILIILIFITNSATQSLSLCDKIIKNNKFQDLKLLDKYLLDIKKINNAPCILDLIPSYYWAQNMTHIFVKIQFLNSADTSACSRVLSSQKNITYDLINIELICIQSSFLLRYRLNIRTFMPLNYHHAIWKYTQLNSILLECLKSPSPYFWKKLTNEKYKPQKKPKIWWKMLQKYKQNLKDFIYDIQTQDIEDDISAYVKKNNKIQKYKQNINPSSDTYFYCNQNNPLQLGSWL